MVRTARSDALLWLAALGLACFSVFLLSTDIVAADGTVDRSWGIKQGTYVALALAAAVVLSRIPIATIAGWWKHAYIAAIGSIGVVFLLGSAIRGSRRWIEVGPINVQPSEIGKVLVIIAASMFIAQLVPEIGRLRNVLLGLGFVAAPALLVFLQPDLGTAQVYGAIGVTMVFFAGIRWVHVAALVGAVVALAVVVVGILPAVGVHVLDEYQMQRLTSFANPEADPDGINYHANQAQIACGSGRILGRGADDLSQVKGQFLPEPQTDFIFSTACESHGFVGGAIILGLFALLFWRVLVAVAIAPTMPARLMAAGVLGMFAFTVLVNVGMTIGLMPITGIPLPFLSYGGSAMVANMLAVGVVASVFRSAQDAPVRYSRRRADDPRARQVLALREEFARQASRAARGRRGGSRPLA